jgi:hypothetical protein
MLVKYARILTIFNEDIFYLFCYFNLVLKFYQLSHKQGNKQKTCNSGSILDKSYWVRESNSVCSFLVVRL